jgi:hypothetical protein
MKSRPILFKGYKPQNDGFEIIKRCNIMLDSLRTKEYRFVAWLIYSAQMHCFIAGIDTYINDEQNLAHVIIKHADPMPFFALNELHKKISEWHDAGSIPLDEAPFFI